LEETAPQAAPQPSNPNVSAQRLAAQLLDEADVGFLDALKSAGLLGELDEEELVRVASEVEETDPERRRVELLDLYYAAGGHTASAERRQRGDRFFLQRVGDPATAAGLVERLAGLTPELIDVGLERIGGDDGPLVLRAGEHCSAVLEDYEEETDTDDFDPSEAEARKRGVPMVTVRGLVRALNVLLDRNGVRERLVSLRGDEEREVYVQLGVAQAMLLAKDGFLEDVEPEEVMDLAGW
jgi:hypothetical protein